MEARKLTPTEKGGIAETAIAWHATRLGIPVLKPATEGLRYDLAFELGTHIARVQCKWGNVKGGVVSAHVGGCRFTPSRGYVRSTYDPTEIELLAIYCAELDQVYVVPIEDIAGQSYVHLRLRPAKNNQRSFVRWASQYELGAIAQLGERLRGTQEVAGSSPASSTPPNAA